jgi:hypothetical protein
VIADAYSQDVLPTINVQLGMSASCGAASLIGVHWDYSDPAKIIEILETANCRFQDIQRVKQTIKERRPGSIDIDLTQEQFDSCVTANNASNVKDD